MAQPESITARDLRDRLERGEPIQLVDVREDSELALARLPQAVLHLPLSRSSQWLAGLDTLLRRDCPVVVLCHAGVRSWQFGSWLIDQQGFEQVWNLEGGIDAWSVQVDPQIPRY